MSWLYLSSSAKNKIQKQDQLRIGNYYLKETIGTGSFGKVKIGEHVSLGIKVAVKIINREKLKNAKNDQRMYREISNMQRLNHPHIVRLYEVIETRTDIFIIMEYVGGGELFDHIISHGKFSEAQGRYYFQQIVSAMSYCHRRCVAHRDLKPENLLLDTKTRTIKIADFGLSNIISDGELLKTACGSPNYAAPEVISAQYYSGPEADVWSCGVILYALLTARLPFDDSYIPHLFDKIREGRYSMPSFLSESCKHLIKSILLVNPVERLTMDEIRQHPWFKESLSRYLEAVAEADDQTFEIDYNIVDEIAVRMKVPRQSVISEIETCVASKQSGVYFVAYQLLADAAQCNKDVTSKDKRKKISLAEFSFSPQVNLREEIPFYLDKSGHNLNILSAIKNGDFKQIEEEGKRKMWYLGIMSTNSPMNIMKEVLLALKKHNFEWKIYGPYQLYCRHCSDLSQIVKIGIQLFSLPVDKQNAGGKQMHLLDIKIFEGQIFSFFDLCAKLVAELKHLED